MRRARESFRVVRAKLEVDHGGARFVVVGAAISSVVRRASRRDLPAPISSASCLRAAAAPAIASSTRSASKSLAEKTHGANVRIEINFYSFGHLHKFLPALKFGRSAAGRILK